MQAGPHSVIVTPTASGKTLCYNLPVLQAALTEQARALYMFPTKALAQDQVAEVTALNEAGNLGVRAFTFDGDTPGDARKAVRTRGDIVVTSPDMLHQDILPHHTKWVQFFESLRFVVIDEMHTYRGMFGSHVANVLRLLHRICRLYGSDPLFILCSATTANSARRWITFRRRRRYTIEHNLIDPVGALSGKETGLGGAQGFCDAHAGGLLHRCD